MASIVTSFFGKYDITVDISAPTTTLDVFTETADSNELQENRQEFRALPREIVKFVEDKIKAAQKNAGVLDIQLDLDLSLFERWDNQLDRVFQNHRNQERWVLSRDIVAGVRELRLTRRTTPITLTFPLN